MKFNVKNLVEVDLHITNKCSLKCKHCCFESGTLNMWEMDFAQVNKLLDDLDAINVHEVHITGGEPLVRKDALDIIRMATNRGFRVRLQTNGLHLKPKTLAQLKETSVESIMVSVDGYSKSHEELRGQNTYMRTMKGVVRAKAANFHVRVNSVVHLDNMESMFPLMNEVCSIGVDIHSFFYYTPHGRGSTSKLKEIPGAKWLNFIGRLEQHWIELGRPATEIVVEQAFVTNEAWNTKLHGCKIAEPDYAQIMCDGRVVPCTMFIVTQHQLGNVTQTPIGLMWHDQKNWEIYENIRSAGKGDSVIEPTGCWAYRAGQNLPPERDPRWAFADGLIPICPIVKHNVNTKTTGPSTTDVA